MPTGASEIDRLESTKPKRKTKRHAEEHGVEAVGYHEKAHEELG